VPTVYDKVEDGLTVDGWSSQVSLSMIAYVIRDEIHEVIIHSIESLNELAIELC
jgi:hypothetical protein